MYVYIYLAIVTCMFNVIKIKKVIKKKRKKTTTKTNHSSSNCPKYVRRTNIHAVKNGLLMDLLAHRLITESASQSQARQRTALLQRTAFAIRAELGQRKKIIITRQPAQSKK